MNMMNRLHEMWAAAWQWLRGREGRGRGMFSRITADKQDREQSEARTRFWTELRAGQQEAEMRSRVQP
jgi:hypothetical protein